MEQMLFDLDFITTRDWTEMTFSDSFGEKEIEYAGKNTAFNSYMPKSSKKGGAWFPNW